MLSFLNCLQFTLFFTLLLHAPLGAAQLVAKPGDALAPLLDAMKPGDTLILTQGTYQAGKNWIRNKRGSKDAWFTVKGQDGAKVIIQNNYKENTFSLHNCSFWRFENLETTGTIGGDAFKWTGSCSDMVIENCYMHDMTGCGINCSSVDKMERLRVTRCQIVHTGGNGEGMYLGHNDGSGCVFDSIFEYNLIHDTGGDQGDGIELNQGGLGNTIRFNVVYNTKYPNILVENNRPGKANVVEGNICWNSKTQGIQVNGNAVVRNNYSAGKDPYELGGSIQEGGNASQSLNEVAPETLLQRGLELLKLDPIVHGKVGLGGKGAAGDPNSALVEHLKGAAGNGGSVDPAEAAPPPPTRQWDEAAIAALRQECIDRLVKLSQTAGETYLSILIAGDAQQVILQPSDAKEGLRVKLPYGGKKNLPWSELSTAMLGETLLTLCDSDADGGLPEDRLRVALCYYVADRQVPAALQVDKIAAVDKDLAGQYPVRVAVLNPAISK